MEKRKTKKELPAEHESDERWSATVTRVENGFSVIERVGGINQGIVIGEEDGWDAYDDDTRDALLARKLFRHLAFFFDLEGCKYSLRRITIGLEKGHAFTGLDTFEEDNL